MVGALSPSRAGDYLTCALLYRFRTIDRLPERDKQTLLLAAVFGLLGFLVVAFWRGFKWLQGQIEKTAQAYLVIGLENRDHDRLDGDVVIAGLGFLRQGAHPA